MDMFIKGNRNQHSQNSLAVLMSKRQFDDLRESNIVVASLESSTGQTATRHQSGSTVVSKIAPFDNTSEAGVRRTRL